MIDNKKIQKNRKERDKQETGKNTILRKLN